jgi:hypothetical protein
MTELESFLIEKREGEYQTIDKCLKALLINECDNAFYRYSYRIPNSGSKTFVKINLNENSLDMISDFKCNIQYSIYIGKNKYSTTRILPLCTPLQTIYALIYLDQPNMPNEVIFSQRQHHFSSSLRQNIVYKMNPNGILDGEIKYLNGMASPLL